MAQREGHHGELEHLALLAGGAGLAYWGWKQGWFHHLFGGSAPAPAAATAPPASNGGAAPLLSPPAVVSYLPAPYSPPTQTYVVAPSYSPPAPNAPAMSYAAPAYYSPSGTLITPSNFQVQYNPETGLELPYAPPGALVPSQNLCDSIFPNNDPTGIYQTNPGDHKTYAHMTDALADDFMWLRQYYPGVATLQQIADGRTGGTGYNGPAAATLAAVLSKVLGLPTSAPIDLSVPKNMVAVLRGFVAGHNGLSYFNTVPDQCFIAGYNQVFSPPISSL